MALVKKNAETLQRPIRNWLDEKEFLKPEEKELLNNIDSFDFPFQSKDGTIYKNLGELRSTRVKVYISDENKPDYVRVVKKTVAEIKKIIEKIKKEIAAVKKAQKEQGIVDDNRAVNSLEDSLRRYEDSIKINERGDDGKAVENPDDKVTTVILPPHRILGEYVRENPNDPPKIYLYINNIGNNPWLLAQVYVHEMHHFLYDTDRGVSCGDHYIPCLEEPLAEFGMLKFIKAFEDAGNEKGISADAYKNVEAKKYTSSICFYGFGAYLYQSCFNIPWTELMVAKNKNPMRTTLVQEYEQEWEDYIYPFSHESSVKDKLFSALTYTNMTHSQNSKSIGNLKDNPIFQLSLSSKELFHSNFLYWLATCPNTLDIFKQILCSMGSTGLAKKFNLQDYVVCREKLNFDFSIWEKKAAKSSKKACKDDEQETDIDDSQESTNIKVDSASSDPTAKLGNVVFVLENKFKSIATKDQLDAYAAQVFKINNSGRGGAYNKVKKLLNVKSNSKEAVLNIYKSWTSSQNYNKNLFSCDFVLLSLAKDFMQKQAITKDGIWTIVSYDKYYSYLQGATNSYLNSGFVYDIISHYASFIEIFSDYVNNNLNKIQNGPHNKGILGLNWNDVLSSDKDLMSIRMDDIWQKLVGNVVAQNIYKEIRKEYPNQTVMGLNVEQVINYNGKVINISAGFSRGTAIIDIKLPVDGDILFGIQIQNGLYKRVLETTKSIDWRKYIDVNKGMFKDFFRPKGINCDWSNILPIFDSEDVFPSYDHNVGKVYEGFGGYGNTFICQSKKIKTTTTVKDVIEMIKQDIQDAQKVIP